MIYSVKEFFYTLQGEGSHTGRAAVFCRFSGCNLWSGRESDRSSAICQFCDTDFVGIGGQGGGKFSSAELLQLDAAVIEELHKRRFEIAIETNGTVDVPSGVDWVCVSPKARAELVVRSGDELKLVFPQADASPDKYRSLRFRHFFLQPMDGPELLRNTQLALDYCLAHPQWRLSLQTHKQLGIP